MQLPGIIDASLNLASRGKHKWIYDMADAENSHKRSAAAVAHTELSSSAASLLHLCVVHRFRDHFLFHQLDTSHRLELKKVSAIWKQQKLKIRNWWKLGLNVLLLLRCHTHTWSQQRNQDPNWVCCCLSLFHPPPREPLRVGTEKAAAPFSTD